MRKITCMILLAALIFSLHSAFADAFVTPDGKRMIAASSTSREAPATLGEIVYIQDVQGNKGSVTEVELLELYSDDEAKRIALDEDSLNKDPADDMQYILARFKISFQSNDHNKNLLIYPDHFSVITMQGNVVKSSLVRDKSKTVYGFHTRDQIYAGATVVIDVPLLLKKVDDVLLINYWNAWFQISEAPPFSDPNSIQFGWSEMAIVDQLKSSLETTNYKPVEFEGGGHRIIFYDASLWGKECYAYYDIKNLSQGVNTMWYSFPLENDGEGATDIMAYLLEAITTSYGRCTYVGHDWVSDNAKIEYTDDIDTAISLGLYKEPMMWTLDNNVSIYIDIMSYTESWKPFFPIESGKAIAVMITQTKKE